MIMERGSEFTILIGPAMTGRSEQHKLPEEKLLPKNSLPLFDWLNGLARSTTLGIGD